MVEGDDYDVSAPDEVDPVVDRSVAAAGGVGSTVDVDEDGTLSAVAESRCPDVEVKAVLAVDGVFFVEGREGRATAPGVDGLWGLRAEGDGVADSLPWLGFDRRLEAGFGGVFAVWDAFEDFNAVVDEASDFAGGCGGDRGCFGERTRCDGCEGGELQHLTAGEIHVITIRHFREEMQLHLIICGRNANAYPPGLKLLLDVRYRETRG